MILFVKLTYLVSNIKLFEKEIVLRITFKLLLEKSLNKKKTQQATANQPLSADRPVFEVAVSSSVDKEGRCPHNVHSK